MVRRRLTEKLRPSGVAAGLVADLFRAREELLQENAFLRQQLLVASRKVEKPHFRSWKRGLLVAIASQLRTWRNALVLVNPDTVLRWHREGFRLLWKQKSMSRKPCKPRIGAETVTLIREGREPPSEEISR